MKKTADAVFFAMVFNCYCNYFYFFIGKSTISFEKFLHRLIPCLCVICLLTSYYSAIIMCCASTGCKLCIYTTLLGKYMPYGSTTCYMYPFPLSGFISLRHKLYMFFYFLKH